ncbi:MAG: tetratricopeptide repeat protein [Bacteroidetes bacterium]|nr:MAG: tetratricopeptide repeat protein [Bacteroidota bacterium]
MANSVKKKPNREISSTSNLSVGLLYLPANAQDGLKGKEALFQSAAVKSVLALGEFEATQDKVQVFSTKSDLVRALEASELDYWLVSDGSTIFNPAKSLNELNGDSSDWYIVSRAHNTEKPGFAHLVKDFFYGVATAFFSPSTHRNAALQTYVAKKDLLLNAFNLFPKQDSVRLQNQVSLLAESRGDFEAHQVSLGKRSGLTRKSIAAGIKDYAHWFFKAPFQQWKSANGFGQKSELASRFLFASFFLLTIIGMPLLSFDYGITWDESLQYNFAKDMYKYFATWGEDESVFDTKKGLWAPMQFYGSFFDLLTVTINNWFGIEDEYAARHFVNALFGAMGILFCGLTARAITGSWTAGFMSFLLLLLSPSYFGHAMNNPKDIPFATGMVAATYYIIRLLKSLPRPDFATKFMLTLSIASALSIRVGALLLFAYLLMGMGLNWLNTWKQEGQAVAMQRFKSYLFIFLPILVFGWALGIAFWPFALKAPVGNVLESLNKMSNFSFLTTYETFDGVRTNMKDLPWYYSVKLIAIGAPLVALLGFVLQLVGQFKLNKKGMWLSLLLCFMVAFPLFWAVYKDSMLYNAWRHSLFIYVNIVILAGAGWAWLLTAKNQILNYAAVALILVGSGRVAYWMVKEHPNEYLYFNELTGGTAGAYGNYELDYYSNTLRQAAEWMVNNVDVHSKKIVIAANNEPLTAQWYFNQYTDSVEVIWTREYELTKKETDYAIFNTRTMSKTTLTQGGFPPKGTIHTIDVDGVPVCAIVKRENQYMPQGYALVEAGKMAEAIEPLKKAVAYDSMNDEAWRMLGLAYLNSGGNNQAEAIQALDKAIEILPENFIAYDVKGMLYFNQRDFVKADSLFQLSISYKVNYTNAHYNRGLALFNMGKYADAVKEFENSVRYGGHKPEFYKLLGMCFMNLNQMDQAIQLLGQSVQMNPNDPQVYQYIGQAYAAKGDQQNAQKFFGQAQRLMGQ